jgi:hypothetical protein
VRQFLVAALRKHLPSEHVLHVVLTLHSNYLQIDSDVDLSSFDQN